MKEIMQSLFFCLVVDLEVDFTLMLGLYEWTSNSKNSQYNSSFMFCSGSLSLKAFGLLLLSRPKPPIHPSASPRQKSHDSLNPIGEGHPWIPHHPNPLQSSPLPWELKVGLTAVRYICDACQQCVQTYCISCLGVIKCAQRAITHLRLQCAV